MSNGIDYGGGITNIDTATGIRYGVIPQGDVLQAWADSSKPYYGDPHCPKCGNEAIEVGSKADTGKDENGNDLERASDRDDDGYECARGACGDYACDKCEYLFDSEEAFGDDPLSYFLDDGEYEAECGDGDIFITKSPYYTRAKFCSPCAPGACYLRNPSDGGEKAFCFGHDFFEDGVAPYPVYRVSDDSLVGPEKKPC